MSAQSKVVRYTRELPVTSRELADDGSRVVHIEAVECSTVVHTYRRGNTVRLKGVQGVLGGAHTWGPPTRSRGRYDFNLAFTPGVHRGA